MLLAFTVFAWMLALGPLITGFKKAPYVPSFNSHLIVMKQHLKLKKGAKIVDLGCGDGKALRFFSKEFRLKGTGYDLNPFVIFYGKLSNFLLWYKDIILIRANFKKASLQHYPYVYMYLFPNQLAAIEDWVFDQVSKDAIIISNSFTFVKHQPYDIITDELGKKVIYLYRK
jgi:SAM-dependent methyltransferase